MIGKEAIGSKSPLNPETINYLAKIRLTSRSSKSRQVCSKEDGRREYEHGGYG